MSKQQDTPPTMVDLDDVHLTLGSASGPVKILRGLNLRVAAGESVAIVGPSGSGKTTMLMVISGLERADQGRVNVAGQDVTAMNETERTLMRRQHMGIVFQGFHLVPTMTALENVALPLEFAGQETATERAREELTAVGLDHRADHYPSQLSGGEQQRVAIARALVSQPGIVLADEPTGNLDEDSGKTVMRLLSDLQKRRHTALILITHNTAHVAMAERVAHLENGRITS